LPAPIRRGAPPWFCSEKSVGTHGFAELSQSCTRPRLPRNQARRQRGEMDRCPRRRQQSTLEYLAANASSPMDPTPNLNIVIVDENPIRAAILKDGLREAGFTQVVRLDETANLLARIYAIDPDVILIDLENPSRDVLEQMFQVSRIVKRPIAMFVDQSDSASIQASVDAGVSAYIVDGLKKERMKHILDLCISRFNAFSRLQAELERAKSALEERKIIDRAKGILMKAKNLTEEQAYALMRKTAMNENKKIVEIAQSIITAADLLR
jgi:two-component system, response regulator / RNA-binding antiterminator